MYNERTAIQCFLATLRLQAPVGLLLVFLTVPVQDAGAQGKGKGRGHASQQQQQGNQLPGNPSNRQLNFGASGSLGGMLSPSQLEQLTSMREEEKLAHDVYIALAQSSGLKIFSSISNAESKHMLAVEQLISRYASIVPLANMAPGVFSDPQIQKLYVELVTAGSVSPTAALSIGARIEEMDIRDLQLVLSQNPPQQVTKVLENLQRASGNHLRAFMGELEKLGATYTPEFLTQPTFNSIVNTSNTRGSGQSANGRQSANGPMGMQMQGSKGKMRGRR
jgi:hypothetical protein